MVANAPGEALQYIPLSIRTNSTTGADKLAIRLPGLPTETVLTSGEDLGNGSWLLKSGEEQDLKLAVQSNAPREIAIGVEAIEMKTGELAAPPQDLRVEGAGAQAADGAAGRRHLKPAVEPENHSRNNLRRWRLPTANDRLAAPGPVKIAPSELPALLRDQVQREPARRLPPQSRGRCASPRKKLRGRAGAVA